MHSFRAELALHALRSPTCPAAAVLQLDLTMEDPRLDPVLPLSIRARVWGLGVTLKQRGGLHFGIHRPTGLTILSERKPKLALPFKGFPIYGIPT